MNIKRLLAKDSLIASKYQIVEFIETGSLGDDIYLCRLTTNTDKMFTVRLLPENVCRDQEMLERFTQEAQINIAMQHHNILPAVEFGNFNDSPFLVTGYIESENLKIYQAQQGRLSSSQVLAIIIPLINALSYAWNEHKIIHRNIKPESILIASPDFPIIHDFGLSKSVDNSADSMDLTMMDITIGNADYMSPEQATGSRDLDFRSDMYCLGLVAYEMLTRQHPFGNLPQIAMMMAQVNRIPKPVIQLNHAVDKKLSDIIAKILEKKVEDRYNSWDDLLDALNSYNNLQRPAVSLKTKPTRTKPKEEQLTCKVDEEPSVDLPKSSCCSVAEKWSVADYGKATNGICIIIVTILMLTVSRMFYYLLFFIGLNLYQASFTKFCLIEKLISKLISKVQSR